MSHWFLEIEQSSRHGSVMSTVEADGDDIVQAMAHALERKRAQMRCVRIAGVYSGPGFGNPWCPSYEGLSSLKQAADRFRCRQESTGASLLDVDNLTVRQGRIVNVERDSTYWPETTPQDTLELYHVLVLDDGTRAIASEPFTRLSAGPRGGVVRENF